MYSQQIYHIIYNIISKANVNLKQCKRNRCKIEQNKLETTLSKKYYSFFYLVKVIINSTT